VLRSALFALFHAAFLGVTVLVNPASGQSPARQATLSEVPLPGGVGAAAAAIGDPATPDRAQFLAEFVRRTYDTPLGAKADLREPLIRSLVAALSSGKEPTETIPLPLSTKFWTDVVFRKQATANNLVASIVQSRNAALFYLGLLSLDDESRTWMADHPSLASEIVTRRAAAFVTAAPGLHITSAGVQVPGGSPAEPVWQALVGHRPSDSTEFVRSVVSSDEGRLAYFFGSMGLLSPSQIRLAMMLDGTDVNRRVDAGRRLYAVFQRLWLGKALDQRVFARPSFDPALLAFQLMSNPNGASVLPGTRGFWTAALNDTRETHTKSAREDSVVAWDQPPDFPWLSEQVFKGDLIEHRRHFMMVLFAARHADRIQKDTARDALEAVRAVGAYPALTATLERAGISDLAVFASAARRAAALTAIEDETRANRSIVQYQGAVAMITRAASRGTLPPDAATKLVSSLSAIPITERGNYDGRIVSWLGAWLNGDAHQAPRSAGPAGDGSADDVYESANGPIEEDALRVLAGQSAIATQTLDWEGTRYRVDLARAEALRLTRSHGDAARPYLSSASAVMGVADALAGAGLTPNAVQQQAASLARVWQKDRPDQPEDELLSSYSDVSLSLQRAARSGDVAGAARIAPSLRAFADELTTRGLMEWTYAAALGPRDGLSISAADAASRHDLGLHSPGGRANLWRPPVAGSDATSQRWRVLGSLLGLDVVLADFSLVSLSSRPPARRPTLGEIDRRVFVDTIALVQPKALSDHDRDGIATALRRGRARLTRAQSSDDASTIADAVAMSPLRRSLLSWTIAYDSARVGAFLSPGELFRLGAGDTTFTSLNAWGVVAASRAGCLCLEVMTGQPTEIFAGRWNTGMAASVFPDLNLRLAELLSDLHMPATLLAPILTSATLDFVNSVNSRDQDDRRGLSEFVQGLTLTRVEQYLALLTSDGPLLPLGDSPKTKGSTLPETAAQMVRQR
jgi:hypothetical protein